MVVPWHDKMKKTKRLLVVQWRGNETMRSIVMVMFATVKDLFWFLFVLSFLPQRDFTRHRVHVTLNMSGRGALLHQIVGGEGEKISLYVLQLSVMCNVYILKDWGFSIKTFYLFFSLPS